MKNKKIVLDQNSLESLQAYGFTLLDDEDRDLMTGAFLTCPLQLEDKRNVIDHLLPNHFKPRDYRSLFIGACIWSGGGYGFYATSDIRGEYRGYRRRLVEHDVDAGNIFASGKTLTECVNNFIDAYRRLKYNRR